MRLQKKTNSALSFSLMQIKLRTNCCKSSRPNEDVDNYNKIGHTILFL